MIYGVVALAGSLVGDEPMKTSADGTIVTGTTGAGEDSTTDLVVSTTTGASAADTARTASETVPTQVTTTTIANTQTVPSPTDPARVLLLGDSEAGGLSPFLEPVLERTHIVTMELDYKVSSGLVRTDFYDWPERLRQNVPAVDPDIVIALFGGNDGQAFLNPSIGPVDSAEWRAEYSRRVGEAVDILTSDGRTLIWVGVPNAAAENLTNNLRVQNEAVKTELARHPDVVFVDAWNHFTGINGGFAPYALDPRDGELKPVRSSDGFHLNSTGEEILAVLVSAAVTADLRARGASI